MPLPEEDPITKAHEQLKKEHKKNLAKFDNNWMWEALIKERVKYNRLKDVLTNPATAYKFVSDSPTLNPFFDADKKAFRIPKGELGRLLAIFAVFVEAAAKEEPKPKGK